MTLDDYRRFYAEEIEQATNLTSPALIEALPACRARGFSVRRIGSLLPLR